MKKTTFFLILNLAISNLCIGQSLIMNNGKTYITVSMDLEDANIEIGTPIEITNSSTVKISGDFFTNGYYNTQTQESYDIVIVPKPNTSIAVVEPELTTDTGGGSIVLPPKNGTTVIRTSGGTVGISNNPRVVVFPNPVKNEFNIESSEVAIVSYLIFDFNGNLIQTNQFNRENELKLNLENLSNGKYLLKLSFENGRSKSVQFLKQ